MKKKIFITRERKSFKSAFVITAVVGLSALLWGCNTMEGLGTDVKGAGEALENSAERAKKDTCPRCCPTCRRPYP